MRMQPEVCDDAAGGPADIVTTCATTVSRRIINPNFAINNIDSLRSAAVCLNAVQHCGHRRFSSQIPASQSFPSIEQVGCCWLWKPDCGRRRQFRGQSLWLLIVSHAP